MKKRNQKVKRGESYLGVALPGSALVIINVFMRTPPGTKRIRKFVVCQCSCGRRIVWLRASLLRQPHKPDCGYHKRGADQKPSNNLIMPISENPEYHIWRTMIQRCTDSRHPSYPKYGGAGIKVHPPWTVITDALGFRGFVDHIRLQPTPFHSIDRIKNDQGYVPGNVRWATAVEQAANKGQGNKNEVLEGG